MTCKLSKPARYFDTGSSSLSLPSSTSIMMATDVTGLVIEAMLKIAFVGIAMLCATSSLPAAPSKSTASGLTTSATTPGASPRATAWLNWRESAALPASKNPRACVCSGHGGDLAFVCASPGETSDPGRAMKAIARKSLWNCIAPESTPELKTGAKRRFGFSCTAHWRKEAHQCNRSLLVDGIEHFLGRAEGIHGRRHAGIDASLKKNFRDFLARDAVIQGSTDMQFDFMRTVQRREHAQIHEASGLAGKAGPGPNGSPAPFSDKFIKHSGELIR